MFGHQDDHTAPVTDNQTSTAPAADKSITPTSFESSDSTATDLTVDTSAPAVDDTASVPTSPATSDYIVTAPGGQPAIAPSLPVAGADGDLLSIKQQALQQLSPLVSHLDQTPEEKFHTTMMMIQAADNQDLIKEAYDAAQAITDEKTRAQALLDIINEINYFTQHNTSSSES